MASRRLLPILGSLFVLAVGVPTASAQFTLQAPELNYIILYEGNGGHQLNVNNFGTTGVWTGNIGIGGTGQFDATGPGTLNGEVDFQNAVSANISNTTITGGAPNASCDNTGPNTGCSGNVQKALSNVNSLSTNLGGEAASGKAITINTQPSGGQTVLASSGTLDAAGNRIFNVTGAFNSNNGENLVIQGSAADLGSAAGAVVFDIGSTSGQTFSGNIILQDSSGRVYGQAGYAGLTPDQVIFNMYGGAGLTGGPTLQANNNGNAAHPANIMEGVFLDPNGAISFVNTRLDGRIFGGDSTNMQIVSGDTITSPCVGCGGTGGQVPEPASLLLLGSGLGLAGFRIRRRQKTTA